MKGDLKGKTLFITGASRGIGRAIALRAARDGANVVVAAKTAQPHVKLPGTIYTTAAEIEEAGGHALACVVDVRDEEMVQDAVELAVKTFGGIDILVNNASAISLTDTQHTPMTRFDLLHQVNTRGTYLTSQACLPHLLATGHGHVLNISPPLHMQEHWFKDHVAYTIAKMGMSLCTLGMAGEFRGKGVAFNALWPKTVISTSAVLNFPGGDAIARRGRHAEIMADAAYIIFNRDSHSCTGQFFIDEEVLISEGVCDFSAYKVDPDLADDQLIPDLFL